MTLGPWENKQLLRDAGWTETREREMSSRRSEWRNVPTKYLDENLYLGLGSIGMFRNMLMLS